MDSSGKPQVGGALGAALGNLLSEKHPEVGAQRGEQPPVAAAPSPTEGTSESDVVVTRRLLDEPLPGAGWQPSVPSIAEDSTAETMGSKTPVAEVTVTPAPSLIEEPVTQPVLPDGAVEDPPVEEVVEVPLVEDAVPGPTGSGPAGSEALAQAADVVGGMPVVESAPSEDGSRVDDLKSRIEETRRRIRRELEQPFDASVSTKPLGGDWTGAPVIPETPVTPVAHAALAPSEATLAPEAPAASLAPEAPAAEVVETLAPPVAEETVAMQAPAVEEAPITEPAPAMESPALETVEVEILPAEPVEMEQVPAEPLLAEPPATEPAVAKPPVVETPATASTPVADTMEYEARVVAEPPLAPAGPAPLAQTPAPAAPAPPEATLAPEAPAASLAPEAPAAEVVETLAPPVAEETVAPAASVAPEATEESAMTTPVDLSATVSDGDVTTEVGTEEPVDYDSMKDRIESTRSRLKAKAFDAMMTGEAALLGRDVDGAARQAGEQLEVDRDIDETIETSLQEEED